MTLTVGEVIALPVVQAGDPEVLSARRWDEPLRWVHGSDLADLSALLQGGELVLTTGSALARSPRKYLQRLASAGAIGVVVELGSQVPQLPGNAAPIAEELDLALVVLHRAIRFVEVTEAVHRRIVAEQYEEVAFDRRVHETFTELSMRRASVGGSWTPQPGCSMNPLCWRIFHIVRWRFPRMPTPPRCRTGSADRGAAPEPEPTPRHGR